MGNSKKEITIADANAQLKAGKMGVAIEVRGIGGCLYLRTTLPPKPGSGKKQPYSQRIALGLRANRFGIEAALARAIELRSQLTWGRFDWAEWGDFGEPEFTAGEWIERYKAHLLKSPRFTQSANPLKKWKNEAWHCGLSGLVPDALVDEENCHRALREKKEGSRQRKLTAQCLKRFAAFCGTEIDLSDDSLGYSLDKVERYIPTNAEVLECWDKIPEDSPWRSFYALAAVYGLRPHEVFLGQVEVIRLGDRDLTVFRVFEGTKTGERVVAPIPEEWVELFGISAGMIMPSVKGNYGDSASKRFKAYGIPFPPYGLRHRYSLAGNTTEGLGTSVTSAFMGHNPAVNQRIYQRHLTSGWALEAFAKKRALSA